ncbi:MAG TPA: arginine--tRNA ligase [Rectinemataceae bacterium]|nr:arginine--tRNA ligase [Rectinemataceae bacterium]
MIDTRIAWKELVAKALAAEIEARAPGGPAVDADELVIEIPPDPAMGDLGFPMFAMAKRLRAAPPAIATALAARIAAMPESASLGSARAVGPYLNVDLARAPEIAAVLEKALAPSWGRTGSLAGRKVMVEFSSPNTNKPLHLGHLRNNALGESVSRILAAAGAEVRKINHINDRGIHICKSMLAYMKRGGGRAPEDEGLKSDHFVGKYYVLFNELKAENKDIETEAQELLLKWEAGDPATRELWKKMNDWAVGGIRKTYERTGISFDLNDFESDTYELGRRYVLEGVERGIFFRAEDGSIQVNLEDVGLDTKVLLRKDGTSIYVTQDIGTAIDRHESWPYDQLIYVVASEQQYHFKVLFEVLRRLGFDWAKDLHHLSYGLVNLPSGRMKTREGTVVDADDLIDELAKLAAAEIEAKGREDSVGDLVSVSEKISLGALHYYLLQTAPTKDMLYDPEASLSFNGDTGPYIQYMGARASSIIRKAAKGEGNHLKGRALPSKLESEPDWALLRLVAAFPAAIDTAAAKLDSSIVANYLHDLAQGFSTWYRDNPVLSNPDADLAASRLELVKAARATFEAGTRLVCIPFLEAM